MDTSRTDLSVTDQFLCQLLGCGPRDFAKLEEWFETFGVYPNHVAHLMKTMDFIDAFHATAHWIDIRFRHQSKIPREAVFAPYIDGVASILSYEDPEIQEAFETWAEARRA